MVKITFLGTGTSQGVPVIGCDCSVCTSTDTRDKRLRSSVLITHEGHHLLIDSGPDFRQQMLRAEIKHLEAILITHEHNDHVIGIDDVRPFNFSSGQPMQVYALPRVAADLRLRFRYVFEQNIPGLPRIQLNEISKDSEIHLLGLHIQTIGVMHGRLPIVGFRIGDFAYLTDVKRMEPEEVHKLKGIRYLVVNALQHLEHPTHFSLSEALAFIATIQPEKAWLTHSSHHLGRTEDLLPSLPEGVTMAWDGLEIIL